MTAQPHTPPTLPRMQPDEGLVWRYLRDHCRGRARAHTQAQIGRALGIPRRAVHDILTRLVVQCKRPIVAACEPPYGHYVATTQAEVSAYAERLRHRLRELWVRICALTAIDDPTQLRLWSHAERVGLPCSDAMAKWLCESADDMPLWRGDST